MNELPDLQGYVRQEEVNEIIKARLDRDRKQRIKKTRDEIRDETLDEIRDELRSLRIMVATIKDELDNK